jgi:hypothetical protein
MTTIRPAMATLLMVTAIMAARIELTLSVGTATIMVVTSRCSAAVSGGVCC